MKKIIVLLIAIFLISPLTVIAQEETTPSSSQTTLDTYTLFWPVFAGKVMGESLYSLKLFKESVGEFFSFGDIKKTEYNITLSEKRAVEAEKLLLVKKDYENGKKTLEAARQKREKILNLLKQAESNNRKVEPLKGKIVTSLNNQLKLFNFLETKVPEDQKQLFRDAIDHINSLLSQIK